MGKTPTRAYKLINPQELQVGSLYWLAGKGVMRLKELTSPPEKTTLTLTTTDGCDYYASPDQVTKKADSGMLRAMAEQMVGRNLSGVGEVYLKWAEELESARP